MLKLSIFQYLLNHIRLPKLVIGIISFISIGLILTLVSRSTLTKFWTTKGLRQGCPLSPPLFSLYISDQEITVKKWQAGGTVTGEKKICLLAYTDGIVLMAKNAKEMKEIDEKARES